MDLIINALHIIAKAFVEACSSHYRYIEPVSIDSMYQLLFWLTIFIIGLRSYMSIWELFYSLHMKKIISKWIKCVNCHKLYTICKLLKSKEYEQSTCPYCKSLNIN